MVVDYGMGNLHSVLKSVQAAQKLAGVRAEIELTDAPEKVFAADKIIFPAKARCPTAWPRCNKAAWAKRFQTA